MILLLSEAAAFDMINSMLILLLQLDTDELTVENAVSKSFHKILQMQLDPIWHQLSMKTKQLVADLKTLRLVLS